jgi:hypothetical protein
MSTTNYRAYELEQRIDFIDVVIVNKTWISVCVNPMVAFNVLSPPTSIANDGASSAADD